MVLNNDLPLLKTTGYFWEEGPGFPQAGASPGPLKEVDYVGVLGQDRKRRGLVGPRGADRRCDWNCRALPPPSGTPQHPAAEADEQQMCFDAAESEYEEALEASEQNGAEGDSPERRETKKVEWRYKFCDQDIEELETDHPITLVCTVPGWSTTWWYGAIAPRYGVAPNIRPTRPAVTWRTWSDG